MASDTSTTQKTASKKAHHITNIRYPFAKTWDKRNTSVEFELANIHFSTANAIRRLMISHVKTVGFRTEPYKACDIKVLENDTPLHNQFSVHRLAMIPINVPNPDKFNVDDYQFIIDVANNTNSIRSITTEDFQIKQISTNKFLPKEEVKRFFPPDPITGDYALLNKLRPKFFVPHQTLSREVQAEMAKDFDKAVEDVMHFHIEAKASVSNGNENGHYSPVAVACYVNTVDPKLAEEGLRAYIDSQIEKSKNLGSEPPTHEKMKRRFELTEQGRFFYINDRQEPNVFTFKIETVGIIPSLVVFHRAIEILKDKITTFVSNMVARNEDVITISPSNQLSGGWDIIVQNEDDTLGNLLQSHLCLMYADFNLAQEQRKLKFVGYKRPHPLEKRIIFVIQSNNDNLDQVITDVIKPGCGEINKMLNKIQSELEATPYFINEIKSIQ
jgi:DNA-directed RNA polymerase subunit L